MDKHDKGLLAIFWGSYCAGATISIPLLWTGSIVLPIVLKFVGMLAAGAATAFTSVIFKYYGDEVVKRIKRHKRIKLRKYVEKINQKANRSDRVA